MDRWKEAKPISVVLMGRPERGRRGYITYIGSVFCNDDFVVLCLCTVSFPCWRVVDRSSYRGTHESNRLRGGFFFPCTTTCQMNSCRGSIVGRKQLVFSKFLFVFGSCCFLSIVFNSFDYLLSSCMLSLNYWKSGRIYMHGPAWVFIAGAVDSRTVLRCAALRLFFMHMENSESIVQFRVHQKSASASDHELWSESKLSSLTRDMSTTTTVNWMVSVQIVLVWLLFGF